jgi:hypothetical protein
MQIRGAASLADVPYWRKTKNRLTAVILPCTRHFLKAILGHHGTLSYLCAITYRRRAAYQNVLSRQRVSVGFRVVFRKSIHFLVAIKSPTISYTVCAPGYKIRPLFTIFWRILIVPYENILEHLSRDDRFKATVYAMNTLLIHKGIYTQKEFEKLFVEWASKQAKISAPEISHETRIPV